MDPGTAESHRDEKCKCISQCGSGKWKDSGACGKNPFDDYRFGASGFD